MMVIRGYLKIDRLKRLQERLKKRPEPPHYRLEITDYSERKKWIDQVIEVKRSGVVGGDIFFGDHRQMRVNITPCGRGR